MGSLLGLLGRVTGLPFVMGVKPFATFLVFGLLLKCGYIHDPIFLSPRYAGFQNGWFLFLVGTLFLMETLADKIPGVDHLLDILHTVLKPLAGAFLGFVGIQALNGENSTHLIALALAVVGSGAVSLMVHTAKATLRLGSTKFTAGLGNGLISGVEDVFAVVGTVLTVNAPWIIGLIVVLFVILFVVFAPIVFRMTLKMLRKAGAFFGYWLGLNEKSSTAGESGVQ
jgi:hypothetical protein